MKDTVIIDLDGTLSDGRERYHLVAGKKRDCEAFHAKLGEDPVNDWCRQLANRFKHNEDYYLEQHTRVVLVSARPASCRAATEAWLLKHYVNYDELHLLRGGASDNTPDQELKRAWLHAYGKERILFAVDDRQKVVDMWREEGLTCLQCADWGERHEATGPKVAKPVSVGTEEEQAMDRRVLFAIDGLVAHGRPAAFASIHAHIGVGLAVNYRVVDRSLQRLRRQGLVLFLRKAGWTRAGN